MMFLDQYVAQNEKPPTGANAIFNLDPILPSPFIQISVGFCNIITPVQSKERARVYPYGAYYAVGYADTREAPTTRSCAPPRIVTTRRGDAVSYACRLCVGTMQ